MRRGSETEEGRTMPLFSLPPGGAGSGDHHEGLSRLTGPGTSSVSSVGNGLGIFVREPDLRIWICAVVFRSRWADR